MSADLRHQVALARQQHVARRNVAMHQTLLACRCATPHAASCATCVQLRRRSTRCASSPYSASLPARHCAQNSNTAPMIAVLERRTTPNSRTTILVRLQRRHAPDLELKVAHRLLVADRRLLDLLHRHFAAVPLGAPTQRQTHPGPTCAPASGRSRQCAKQEPTTTRSSQCAAKRRRCAAYQRASTRRACPHTRSAQHASTTANHPPPLPVMIIEYQYVVHHCYQKCLVHDDDDVTKTTTTKETTNKNNRLQDQLQDQLLKYYLKKKKKNQQKQEQE
jgi:hypothetical protein